MRLQIDAAGLYIYYDDTCLYFRIMLYQIDISVKWFLKKAKTRRAFCEGGICDCNVGGSNGTCGGPMYGVPMLSYSMQKCAEAF